jgi:hypothetical protein
MRASVWEYIYQFFHSFLFNRKQKEMILPESKVRLQSIQHRLSSFSYKKNSLQNRFGYHSDKGIKINTSKFSWNEIETDIDDCVLMNVLEEKSTIWSLDQLKEKRDVYE